MALGLTMILGFVAARLKLPPLVGYLLAGVLIGPNTRGFVSGLHLAGQLAEISRFCSAIVYGMLRSRNAAAIRYLP